jgi:hypothetical protein
VTQRGSAGADYLAVIAVVGIVFAGLLVMRPQRVGPKAPVDVIPPIVRLLGHPVQNLAPKPAAPRQPAKRPTQPRKRATRRPGSAPALVLLPDWWRSTP